MRKVHVCDRDRAEVDELADTMKHRPRLKRQDGRHLGRGAGLHTASPWTRPGIWFRWYWPPTHLVSPSISVVASCISRRSGSSRRISRTTSLSDAPVRRSKFQLISFNIVDDRCRYAWVNATKLSAWLSFCQRS